MTPPMAHAPFSIPSLTTDRLSLVPLSFSHSGMMFTLWSRPEICEYAGPGSDYEGNKLTLPATEPAVSDKLIEFWLHAHTDGWGFRWAVLAKQSNEGIGLIGFNSLTATSEIAYFLHPDFWGNGLMSEAANAAIDWRLALGGCTELEAFIDPPNVKSIALAERLRFSATETFSDGARRYCRKFRGVGHKEGFEHAN